MSFYMANFKLNIDLVYPVGSIYMSVNSTNPSILFGGLWEQIKGRFLLGVGVPSVNTDNYFGDMSGIQYNASSGSTGGQDYHTLTIAEIPSHKHKQSLVGGSSGNPGQAAYSWSIPSNRYEYEGADLAIPAGGGQAHNNMPPYFAVYMWKRTA